MSRKGNVLNQKNNVSMHHHKGHEDYLITAIAVGSTLILIGTVFAINANLFDEIGAFFRNLTPVSYPLGSAASTISLPAPANPAGHAVFYTALMQFALGIGILQIVILALRLRMKSTTRRIAETVGNLVFWVGAAVLVNSVLAVGTIDSWFQFWGAFIIVVGVSLVARAIVYLAKK